MDPNVLRLAMGAGGAGADEYRLYTFGQNANGRLGDGTTTNRSSPIQVGLLTDWSSVSFGNQSSAAIKTDGTLWTWGTNSGGTLGDGTTTNKSSPIQIGSLTNWKQISVGANFMAAVKTDGTLWTWGSNGQGQLGDGTTTGKSSPIQIGSLTNWSSVSCGRYRVIALKTNGTIWAWGTNINGALGLGDETNRSSPTQIGSNTNWKQVYAGFVRNNIAVKTDGTLWTWGESSYFPADKSPSQNRSSPIQIGSGTNWSSCSCGEVFYQAIKTDGTLWAWGASREFMPINNPYPGYGNIPEPTQAGYNTNWLSLSTGENSTLALKTDGTLWAWGKNNYGQLGLGNTTLRSSPVQVGSSSNWNAIGAGTYASGAITKN